MRRLSSHKTSRAIDLVCVLVAMAEGMLGCGACMCARLAYGKVNAAVVDFCGDAVSRSDHAYRSGNAHAPLNLKSVVSLCCLAPTLKGLAGDFE